MSYMCVKFDKNRPEFSGGYIFFPTYSGALKFAKQIAITLDIYDSEKTSYMFYVKIFKLPHYHRTVIDDGTIYYQGNYHNHILVRTVYDPKTTAANLIQKHWRVIYNRRVIAASLIKKQLKWAIANPYTELCKRRLLREFEEMSKDF
jgi:hypothetical protein